MLRKIGAALRDLLIGLAVTVVVTVPWSVIAAANLRQSPRVPWAIPVGLTYLGLTVAYLSGHGWPTTTTAFRQRDFRFRRMSGVQWRWSLLTGVLAVTCLWLLYAALGNLGGAPTSPGREAALPAGVLFIFLLVSAAVTAIGEEGGLRGFAQARLERRFGPRVAIVASTLAFVLIHATHGLPMLVRMAPFYVAVGVVYGLLAYLTQSILPAVALHFVGDTVTFGLRSSLIRLSGPQSGVAILLCLGSGVVLGALSLFAFRRLAAVGVSA